MYARQYVDGYPSLYKYYLSLSIQILRPEHRTDVETTFCNLGIHRKRKFTCTITDPLDRARLRQHCAMADWILWHLQCTDDVRPTWRNWNLRVLGLVPVRGKQWKHRGRNHRNLRRLSSDNVREKRCWTSQQPNSHASRHHGLDDRSQCNEPYRPCISDNSLQLGMYWTRSKRSPNTFQRLCTTTWRRHWRPTGCWTLCTPPISRLPHQYPSKPATIETALHLLRQYRPSFCSQPITNTVSHSRLTVSMIWGIS